MKSLVAIAVATVIVSGCATTDQSMAGGGCVFYQIDCSRAASSERKRARAAAWDAYESDRLANKNRPRDPRMGTRAPSNSGNQH